MGPKSVASKPGPVVPRPAAAAKPAPAVKAAVRAQRQPAAQAVAHAAPQARFQREAASGASSPISIPKGETITPIAAPSTGNAHGYIAGMAAAARGAPARPGYTRPIVPKT
jgi:hypothetical protein